LIFQVAELSQFDEKAIEVFGENFNNNLAA